MVSGIGVDAAIFFLEYPQYNSYSSCSSYVNPRNSVWNLDRYTALATEVDRVSDQDTGKYAGLVS